MKKNELPSDCFIYGNKGNVWSNTSHIYKSGVGNLCNTPALATNWAMISQVEEVGCQKCIETFNNQNNEKTTC